MHSQSQETLMNKMNGEGIPSERLYGGTSTLFPYSISWYKRGELTGSCSLMQGCIVVRVEPQGCIVVRVEPRGCVVSGWSHEPAFVVSK